MRYLTLQCVCARGGAFNEGYGAGWFPPSSSLEPAVMLLEEDVGTSLVQSSRLTETELTHGLKSETP